MTLRRKVRHGGASPAACLLPQIEENRNRRYGSRRRDRDYAEDASPGKLYTYVSAGNIELPEDNSERTPVQRMGVRPVVLLAALLLLIWLFF